MVYDEQSDEQKQSDEVLIRDDEEGFIHHYQYSVDEKEEQNDEEDEGDEHDEVEDDEMVLGHGLSLNIELVDMKKSLLHLKQWKEQRNL
jgi:hypothetical protein